MIEYEKYKHLIKGPFTNISDAVKEAGHALAFIKIFIPSAKIIIGGSLPFYNHYADKNTDIVMNDLDAALLCNTTNNKMVYHWASTLPPGTLKTITRPGQKECYIVPIGDLDLHIEHVDYRKDIVGDLLRCENTDEPGVFIYNKFKTYSFYKELNREKDQIKIATMEKKLNMV